MVIQTNAFQKLELLCQMKNFKRRGTAFFRVYGDGVLQILKVEKIPYWDAYEIFLDLFSMYDELDSSYFSSKSCTVRYPVVAFCGKHSAQYSEMVESHYEVRFISLDRQVSLLEDTVLPFLDSIKTQTQLANAMCTLDKLRYSKILWNDIHKYFPFLSCHDFCSAQRVIHAILDQHKSAVESRKTATHMQKQKEWFDFWEEQDKLLLEKLQTIADEDSAAIDSFLNENFQRNCILSKLFKKKGR